GNELHKDFYFAKDNECSFGGDGEIYNLDDEDKLEKALAIIKGNAGIFQNLEYSLFCHFGQRYIKSGPSLVLSNVVKEYQFAPKIPFGSLFSVEILPNGIVKFLYNRNEIFRNVHGNWIFKNAWKEQDFRDFVSNFIKKNLNVSKVNTDGASILIKEIIDNLRCDSHGGTLIICSKKNFDRWNDSHMIRHTEALKTWDNIVVEKGNLQLLTELTSQDGATFLINKDDRLKATGKYVLYPVYKSDGKVKIFKPDTFIKNGKTIDKFWVEGSWKNWQKEYERYGTRHLSSIGFSAIVKKDAILITVSEDGPITVFFDGYPKRDISLLQ
ncbi:MAG: DNA integrity scanning protein DisA nucleotide-binding domain protein, partial [Patescibacteria group bacterium]|nr:DNA integrity scanning protein DisA nucleotide-binding domain protein [Patescibacteria group bacterium]